MVSNKKGFTTLSLIVMVIFGLVLMITLIVGSWGFGLVDDNLSELTFDIGNTSFNETYQNTLQPGLQFMETTVPQIISTGVLMGMILTLMIVGHLTKRMGRLWILFDIIIIIVAEAIAASISSGFTTFINSDPQILAVASTNLPAGSKFIMNLPIIVPFVGMLVMLATHLIIREKIQEERPAF